MSHGEICVFLGPSLPLAQARAVLQDPQVRKRLAEQGISPSGASADELAKFMRIEVVKYRKVVEAAKITAE